MSFRQRSTRILGVSLGVIGILLATHLGEFWPFSIYPMFSQAGKTWTRSLIKDVTHESAEKIWEVHMDVDHLPGDNFAITTVGINQNDVANYLQKAGRWTDRTVGGMRRLFEEELPYRDLLLYRVQGGYGPDGKTIQIKYTPFMLMKADTTIINPNLEVLR